LVWLLIQQPVGLCTLAQCHIVVSASPCVGPYRVVNLSGIGGERNISFYCQVMCLKRMCAQLGH
jgi:hypothetical protein